MKKINIKIRSYKQPWLNDSVEFVSDDVLCDVDDVVYHGHVEAVFELGITISSNIK